MRLARLGKPSCEKAPALSPSPSLQGADSFKETGYEIRLKNQLVVESLSWGDIGGGRQDRRD